MRECVLVVVTLAMLVFVLVKLETLSTMQKINKSNRCANFLTIFNKLFLNSYYF